MADYYLRFSCIFDVGSAESAQKADTIRGELAAELDRDEGAELGFDVEVDHETGPGALWISADEYGEPEHVTRFVLRCAATLNLSGFWGFCWATSCSKPRLDAFGGGACLLDLTTRQEVASVGCADWLTDKTTREPDRSEPSPEADKQRAGMGHITGAATDPLYRLFRVSSGHLTPANWTWLDAQFADGGSREPGERTPTDLPGGRTQEGWFLYALEDADDTIPADLAEVFDAARSLNADYVLLEPEGPVSSALPVPHPDFREELSDTTAPER